MCCGAYVNLVLAVRGCSDGRMTAKGIRTKPARPLCDLEFSLLGEIVSVSVLGHGARATQASRQPAGGSANLYHFRRVARTARTAVHSATFGKAAWPYGPIDARRQCPVRARWKAPERNMFEA